MMDMLVIGLDYFGVCAGLDITGSLGSELRGQY